jgi:hypothetical protein
MAKSRGALILIIFLIGALFFLSGLVFTLQGEGIVGPSSSFMFRSPTWISDGLGILAVGIILLGVGFFFRLRSRSLVEVPHSGEPSTA